MHQGFDVADGEIAERRHEPSISEIAFAAARCGIFIPAASG
jgi:hypothetical protein